MDPAKVLKQKVSSDYLQKSNRRSVEVKVTRIFPQQSNYTDINNNRARLLTHPVNPPAPSNSYSVTNLSSPMNLFSSIDLPAVSLCFALIQILLYMLREKMGITSEEMVYASWKTVVTKGEVWRLLYAQFFHFGKVHIFFNVVTLMGIGRSLEKKIKKPAFAMIIFVMSVISNLMYIFISDILCTGPHSDYTLGFNTAMVSLKMIHIFTMDSEANNGKGDPNLIFGFFPVHLPPYISPWQPVLEAVFFDIFVIERCVASTISGMFSGLLFPYLMKNYRNYIMLPRNPPPPPKIRPRPTSSQDSDDNNNNSASDGPSDDDNDSSHNHSD